MELRHIRYFLAVVEEKNISRAAEKIGIGQPPLSLQIRDLEEQVGTRLFHRMPQGVELTAAGKAFHDLVKEMPAQLEHAVAAAQRAARGELGSLRVGYTGSVIFNPVVSVCIREYRRLYPDVHLRLEESATPNLMNALREGELDVAFLRQGVSDASDLHIELLSEEPLVAVLPVRHPAAEQEVVDLGTLRDDPFILIPRDVGPTVFDTVIAACCEAGFEPEMGQVAPQISSIVSLVAADMGVSLVPESIMHVQSPGAVFRNVRGCTATAWLTVAWRRSDSSPFLRNFISITRA